MEASPSGISLHAGSVPLLRKARGWKRAHPAYASTLEACVPRRLGRERATMFHHRGSVRVLPG